MFDSSMFDLAPKARPEAVVQGEKYRFTVLTPRLLRLEYSENGVFEDRPTKLALRRDFPVPDYTVSEEKGWLVIRTDEVELRYDKKPFAPGGLNVYLLRPARHKRAHWSFGQEQPTIYGKTTNLGGTLRTQDNVNGEADLGSGLVDRTGVTVLDDSKTLVLKEDGSWEPLTGDRIDLYFFGHSEEAVKTVQAFCALSGKIPMIPRWALGNWWSRYWKYTEQSYNELLDTFNSFDIPLSVAVLDMDWHLTKLDPKYGDGWTAHSWNRDFFPDPPRFLKGIHSRGLKVTMNLHPHQGVRPFEDRYEVMAKEMGQDPAEGKDVLFDASEPAFMEAYLKEVIHPLEEDGVDFWWIDWQQLGGFTKEGDDPLWELNHAFYTDNGRKGGYPVLFSRYGGLGSHRYPLGFSGDANMTWESLDFQPYFTSTAANVAYGWWSHDIGGHARGVWSDELQLRWLQFGVFSPILRLHSGKQPFLLKEPWSFPKEIGERFADFMRLRHKLIPYLYTMAYRAHRESRSLAEPLYYEYGEKFPPLEKRFRNEYLFGTELLVCPVTAPASPVTGTACTDAWLPEGAWIDFFNHRIYRGGRSLKLYRGLSGYPVLAKAGAIVPLDAASRNGAPLPEILELQVFCGDNGSFTLYEDNGSLTDTKAAFTPFTFTWGKEAKLVIGPVEGDASATLTQRSFRVKFVACEKPSGAKLVINGKEQPIQCVWEGDAAVLSDFTLTPADRAEITLSTSGKLIVPDYKEEIVSRLARYQTVDKWKNEVYDALNTVTDKTALLAQIAAITDDSYLLGEICEILSLGE
ncbi:MAG: DUF5110 domain-containing protein [Clostridia bacterium]|nr:DUF5110 domain-containing protein [Clostridia bacterium]